MSYVVLARKKRPKNFKEVVGQKHITTILENAISSGKISHSYLFSGPSGVGKTTVARILAKSINCEKGVTIDPCDNCSMCNEITGGYSIDVIEIDGASNRGIDEVRELRDSVKFSPAKSRFKVYIIDEVHMLTEPAFNALLKTLEEPPSYTVFIFATTEPQKVLWTIRARCQQFHFNRIVPEKIENKLKEIVKEENINIQEEILSVISKTVEGSMRDALTVLDQLIAKGKDEIKIEDAFSILGIIKLNLLIEITDSIIEKDIDSALKVIDKVIIAGYDCKQISKGLIEHFRNLLILKISSKPEELINLSKSDIEKLKVQSDKFQGKFEIIKMFDIVKELDSEIKFASQPRIILELNIVKLTQMNETMELNTIMDKINELEKKIGTKPVIDEISVSKKEIKNDVGGEDKLIIEEIQDASHLNKFKNLWPDILEKVKEKKPSLQGFLSGVKLIEVTVRKISIEIENEFYKEMLEKPENKVVIDNVITDVYKRPFEISWIVSKQQKESIAEKETNIKFEMREQEKSKSDIPETVKKAVKIFGGRLIK